MAGRVIGDPVLPAPPDHVHPGPGKDPAGMGMRLVALDRPLVHVSRPGVGEPAVLGEVDEGVMDKYIHEKGLYPKEVREVLRRATILGTIIPVLCGASAKNKGIQPLLDAITDYLPSPLDIPPVKGINPDTDEEIMRELAKLNNQDPRVALFDKL